MKYTVEFLNGAVATVEVEPEIFTDEWMESYRWHFDNDIDTVEKHVENLAWLVFNDKSTFWEGYGKVGGYPRAVTILDESGGNIGKAVVIAESDPEWEVEDMRENEA